MQSHKDLLVRCTIRSHALSVQSAKYNDNTKRLCTGYTEVVTGVLFRVTLGMETSKHSLHTYTYMCLSIHDTIGIKLNISERGISDQGYVLQYHTPLPHNRVFTTRTRDSVSHSKKYFLLMIFRGPT